MGGCFWIKASRVGILSSVTQPTLWLFLMLIMASSGQFHSFIRCANMIAQHLGELMCLVTADTVHCPGHLPLTAPDTVKTVQEMPQQAGLWSTALACIQVTCGACWSTHMPTSISKGWSPARDCIQVMVPGDTNSACLELGPSSGPLTPSSAPVMHWSSAIGNASS